MPALFRVMRRLVVALAALAMVSPVGATLQAQAVRISGFAILTEVTPPFAGFTPGTIAYAFNLPANLQPDFDDDVLIGFDDVLGRFTQGSMEVLERGDLSFFVQPFGGGFLFVANDGVLLNVASAQLFTGGPGNRTFLRGSFAVSNYNDPRPILDVQRAVTITSVSVPEPSAFLLLSTGLMVLVWAGRTRRRFPL